MQLEILYHGNCFDGCASAALFGRFLGEREGARLAACAYRPLQHQQGDPFPPDAFDADRERLRRLPLLGLPGLHWWFDHHASAFPTPADRAAFERDALAARSSGTRPPRAAPGSSPRTLARSVRLARRRPRGAGRLGRRHRRGAVRVRRGGGAARGAGAADHDAPRGHPRPGRPHPDHRGDAAPAARRDCGGALGDRAARAHPRAPPAATWSWSPARAARGRRGGDRPRRRPSSRARTSSSPTTSSPRRATRWS